MCSNSSLKSLSQLKTKFTWDHHRGENYSNDSGQLLFFILILSPPGAWAFSGDFTTNLARQCRAFSGALKIEKLKAPLFRGTEGAGATDDWCINGTHDLSLTLCLQQSSIFKLKKTNDVMYKLLGHSYFLFSSL